MSFPELSTFRTTCKFCSMQCCGLEPAGERHQMDTNRSMQCPWERPSQCHPCVPEKFKWIFRIGRLRKG